MLVKTVESRATYESRQTAEMAYPNGWTPPTL